MSQFQRQQARLYQQSIEAEQILEGSLIAGKIDLMKNSIAEISQISRGKVRQNLQKMQDDHKIYRQQIEREQQRMRKQARRIEDQLLSLEKQAIVRSAGLENLFDPILNQIRKVQEEIVGQRSSVQQKYSEFRDKITTMKVRLAEMDIIIRQKVRVFEHASRLKLTLLEGKLQNYTAEQTAIPSTRQLEMIKTLRRGVEEESKKQQRQEQKIGKLIKEFKLYVDSTINEQQKKQKQDFQQNYNTLENLFVLLSSQYDTKY